MQANHDPGRNPRTTYLLNVKRWQSSIQRYRWVACELLEIEVRMRKVSNYKYLNKMAEAIQADIEKW